MASMDPTNWGQPPGPTNTSDGQMSDGQKSQYVQKQQRWLLFLRHCAKCRQNEAECQLQSQCKFGKQLWQHILHCANAQCEYPRCTSSKDLLKHHQKCQVCGSPKSCSNKRYTYCPHPTCHYIVCLLYLCRVPRAPFAHQSRSMCAKRACSSRYSSSISHIRRTQAMHSCPCPAAWSPAA